MSDVDAVVIVILASLAFWVHYWARNFPEPWQGRIEWAMIEIGDRVVSAFERARVMMRL